jgi:hypothetical protein
MVSLAGDAFPYGTIDRRIPTIVIVYVVLNVASAMTNKHQHDAAHDIEPKARGWH